MHGWCRLSALILPFPPAHDVVGAPGENPVGGSDAQGLPGPGEQGNRQGKGREGDNQAGGHLLAVGGPNLEGSYRGRKSETV